MIEKDVNLSKLQFLFQKYKKNYKPSNNKFTHNLVYKLDNKYVSFLIYTVIYENVEVIDIFTLDEYKKRGFASILLTKMINENNNKNITLEVSEKNIKALNLYEKLGFKKVAIRKGYYIDSNAFLMLKK